MQHDPGSRPKPTQIAEALVYVGGYPPMVSCIGGIWEYGSDQSAEYKPIDMFRRLNSNQTYIRLAG